jgi:hypothetical protein
VTRDEVLAEIRRRAHREHGTLVQALNLILDEEIASIRRSAAALVEEALFRAFNLWPEDQPVTAGRPEPGGR